MRFSELFGTVEERREWFKVRDKYIHLLAGGLWIILGLQISQTGFIGWGGVDEPFYFRLFAVPKWSGWLLAGYGLYRLALGLYRYSMEGWTPYSKGMLFLLPAFFVPVFLWLFQLGDFIPTKFLLLFSAVFLVIGMYRLWNNK